MNHKPGDEILISENGIEGNICIHALYSIIPRHLLLCIEPVFLG